MACIANYTSFTCMYNSTLQAWIWYVLYLFFTALQVQLVMIEMLNLPPPPELSQGCLYPFHIWYAKKKKKISNLFLWQKLLYQSKIKTSGVNKNRIGWSNYCDPTGVDIKNDITTHSKFIHLGKVQTVRSHY